MAQEDRIRTICWKQVDESFLTIRTGNTFTNHTLTISTHLAQRSHTFREKKGCSVWGITSETFKCAPEKGYNMKKMIFIKSQIINSIH